MQIFVIFLVFGSLGAAVAEKLKVGVYYETLCGDSKRFIRSQLYPLMKEGGNEVLDIEFVPYGKATTKKSGSSYSFTCQHGRDECNGNIMHSCAIKYLNKEQTLDFIRCSMAASYPPTSLDDCSEEIGVPESIHKKIKECSTTSEGKDLLAENGRLTDALEPKLFFVPTITYGGHLDVDKMWGSQGDFRHVVCEELNPKPSFCKKSSTTRRLRRRFD